MSCFFSVIIPVYNTEKYLNQCVDSVLSQTFNDYEIILVNDGSKDNSAFICDEYAKNNERVKVIHKENGGAASARNCGLKVATGEYVFFVDSDDFLCTENCLSTIYSSLVSNPSKFDVIIFKAVKSYGSDSQYIDYYGDYCKEIISSNDPVTVFKLMLKSNKQIATPCNRSIRRSLLADNNILFKEGTIAEDVPWSVELFEKAESILAINENIYAYRQGVDGSVTSSVTNKKFEDLYNIVDQLIEKYSSSNTSFSEVAKAFTAFEYSILLYNVSFFDNYKEYSFVKEKDFIFKYSLDKKTRIVRSVYKIMGFSMLMKLFRAKRGFKK